ncbi:MAG: WYL domain-containing protein [Chitinophagaceae bacterium]|nr:WYL domain-containing protein [Chitinophagaceae bacterium]
MKENRSYRVLKMLVLLAGNRYYSLQELMEKYENSERNIHRDLALIEECGFALERDKRGYRLQQTGNKNVKTLSGLLHFTEEEAAILYQTLLKLEGDSAVKETLRKKMNVFYDLKVIELLRQRDDLAKIQVIRDSIVEKKQVRFKAYRSSHSGSIEDRVVEVFDFLEDYSSAWCYDCESHSCKQFKMSRIETVELLPGGWRYEAHHKKFFTDIFRFSAEKPVCTVEMALSLKAYNFLIELYPSGRELIKREGNKYRLKVPIADYEGISIFVLGMLEEVEIHKPVRYKKYLQERVRKYLKT